MMGKYFGALLLCLLASTCRGLAADIQFQPLKGEALSPERGFYRAVSDDFATVSQADLEEAYEIGARVVYGLIRLDAHRKTAITPEKLEAIENAFTLLRKSGLKAFVRVAYNYPENEQDYLDAKDASLPMVKQHIAQLAPIIARHRAVIVVLQAGFIGAWGEGHTSSNELDSFEAKTAVMKMLLAEMPKDLNILWRYPPDVMTWREAKIEEYQRIGLHNDCFLSSPTDVGTYAEDKALRKTQRAAARLISADTYYMGETCGADPKLIRADCKDILREGAEFHVSSLNRDYYEGHAKRWKKQGCYSDIAAKLGYRLRLISAARSDDDTFAVVIKNEGWARTVSARPLVVTWDGGGEELSTTTKDLAPGDAVTLNVKAGSGQICLAAPDPMLRDDARYALRFANADGAGQMWDDVKGRFCFQAKR
jgi:archaellum component FlaF (FlaF/FlaG flagellin family)